MGGTRHYSFPLPVPQIISTESSCLSVFSLSECPSTFSRMLAIDSVNLQMGEDACLIQLLAREGTTHPTLHRKERPVRMCYLPREWTARPSEEGPPYFSSTYTFKHQQQTENH